MAPGVVFEVGALPQLLAVAGMLGLGVALLVLHFESRLNRVFSLFLILRGLSMFTATQWQLTRFSDATTSAFWVELFPYFTIAAPLVLAYFVWIYPRPRRRVTPEWLPAAIVAAVVAGLEIAYILEPSLWGTYAVSAEGTLSEVSEGPLGAMLGVLFVMFAVAGLAFARDAAGMAPGPHRRSLLLVSLAFTMNALYDGVSTGLVVVGVLGFPTGIVDYLGAASLVPALAAPALLARQALASGDETTRRDALRYGAACAMAVAIPMGTIFVTALSDVFLVATGILRLALPLLVAYALLRHQLFDIDLKVRVGVERGTLGATFAGVFFIASEGLEQIVPVQGAVLGLLAAGAIALALKPIQAGIRRVTMKALPASGPIEEFDDEEGRKFYRQQARIVWSDDNVTEKERRMLDNLRETLDLPEAVAERIEAEAVQMRDARDSDIRGRVHA